MFSTCVSLRFIDLLLFLVLHVLVNTSNKLYFSIQFDYLFAEILSCWVTMRGKFTGHFQFQIVGNCNKVIYISAVGMIVSNKVAIFVVLIISKSSVYYVLLFLVCVSTILNVIDCLDRMPSATIRSHVRYLIIVPYLDLYGIHVFNGIIIAFVQLSAYLLTAPLPTHKSIAIDSHQIDYPMRKRTDLKIIQWRLLLSSAQLLFQPVFMNPKIILSNIAQNSNSIIYHFQSFPFQIYFKPIQLHF